jgi:hypothetical protein
LRVVSDTTTLIAFLGLGRMSVLKELFGKLAIPKAVYEELHQKTVPALEEWAEVIDIKDRRSYRSYRKILRRWRERGAVPVRADRRRRDSAGRPASSAGRPPTLFEASGNARRTSPRNPR